jgi:D-3-phosphoglycerate dehydrogenase / 2-oxoglutarate reductase
MNTRFNVVMTAPVLAEPAAVLLESAGCAVHYMPPYPSAALVAELTAKVQADAILCRQGRVDGSVMDASPRLQIVARHGVGVDEVDIAAAASRGLLVTRAPGSNTRMVAEHTMAMLLALAKQLAPLTATVAAGGWRGATGQVRDIAGSRLGLVGFGAIGRSVARLAHAFDIQVTAYDPLAPADAFTTAARAPSLAALLPDSDFLSIHCPLSAETHHIIDATALAALPRGAFIINTARGGLIDEKALQQALDSGHIAGAALDGFENEPPPANHPLRNHPSVIATPHVAGVTPGALIGMGVMAAECIVARLTGQPIPPERIVRGA